MFRLDDIARYLATRLSSLSVFEAWIFFYDGIQHSLC